MKDYEQISMSIDAYMNLLRILQADDMKREVNNQLRQVRAKLEAFGVTVDNLTIE